jgi:EAL domain-containing protein (putative c-di-GMP-specific phosphodiesterase class I)
MMVVAEGIEQASHIQRVLDLGCPFGQGYFIQRPMPPDDVLAYLAEHGRWITLPALAAA